MLYFCAFVNYIIFDLCWIKQITKYWLYDIKPKMIHDLRNFRVLYKMYLEQLVYFCVCVNYISLTWWWFTIQHDCFSIKYVCEMCWLNTNADKNELIVNVVRNVFLFPVVDSNSFFQQNKIACWFCKLIALHLMD